MKRISFAAWVVALIFCVGAFVDTHAQFGRALPKMRESAKVNQNQSSESVTTVAAVPPLLIEDFTQPAGTALTSAGWTAHSAGGTNPIVVSAPSLTLSGYPGSGVGGAVSLATSGEDDNKTFATQSTGDVYAAFLVTVSDAAIDPIGGYFFHLGPDPIGTTFRGRVFIKKDASNNIAFGISKAATAAPDVAFTPFSYSLNTTYLIVVKYSIVAGTTNDTVQMFVSTTVPATEPAPTVSATDIATQGDISPGSVALRQGAAATSPTVRVDGIRVGTTWDSVTKAFISKAPLDMDGDGRTDYVVLRDSNGATAGGFVDWYVNLNASSAFYKVQWGIYDVNTEDLAPADYDGDGKTDIAVWRKGASLATFYIIRSADNTIDQDQLGLSTDQPLPADYSGDGKADTAVVRNNGNGTSTWYYRPNTSVNYSTINLPAQGSPLVGDYNGDGTADPAAFSDDGAGGGRFNILLSGGPTLVVTNFGQGTDMAAPGDYDGDGKSDICVIRNVGGTYTWEYKRSIDGAVVSDSWGLAATDSPTPGDYNGDGKWDYSVWRGNAQGEFFIMTPVTRNIFGRQWGLAGDFPVAFHAVANT